MYMPMGAKITYIRGFMIPSKSDLDVDPKLAFQ